MLPDNHGNNCGHDVIILYIHKCTKWLQSKNSPLMLLVNWQKSQENIKAESFPSQITFFFFLKGFWRGKISYYSHRAEGCMLYFLAILTAGIFHHLLMVGHLLSHLLPLMTEHPFTFKSTWWVFKYSPSGLFLYSEDRLTCHFQAPVCHSLYLTSQGHIITAPRPSLPD